MIDIDFAEVGNTVDIIIDHAKAKAKVVELPFYDPKKRIAKQ